MKKILVVEDDRPMSWLLEKVLTSKYEVVVANNGLEAWSWLSDGNIPDLILSDINMPVMGGVELLENLSISGLHKNTPVIMLSSDVDPLVRQQCLGLGAFAYLVKPFEPQRLLEEIEHPFVSKMFL